jgi:integrase
MTDSKPTFLRFVEDHKNLIWRSCKKQHIDYSLGCARRFADFKGMGDQKLTKIRASDVLFYMDHLVTDCGLAYTTANRHGVTISKIMRFTYDNEYCKRPISVDLYDEDSARQLYFTPDQIERILRFLKGNNEVPYAYHMSLLSLHTGMRLGEILQLQSGKAHLWLDEDGDQWIHLPETKWNGKGRKTRDVPLNVTARQAVASLEYLWDSWNEKAFYEAWREMRIKVFGKDDKDVVFHIWRHTFATRLANDLNITSLVIGKVMGHSNLKTTSKYVKLKAGTVKEVMRQSDELGTGLTRGAVA